MGSLLRDIRYSLRSLSKDKGFTLTVGITMAVCIAANAATLAVVYCVLLKPLPVADANRIVIMSNQYPKAALEAGYESSGADYYDRIRDVAALSEQAMFQTSGKTLETGGVPERITGMSITPSLLPLLRASPAYGRNFTNDEGEIGAEQKAILSDGLSRQLFGTPAAGLGKELRLSGRVFQVVGVMPAGFHFIDPDVRLWTPLALTADQKQGYHSNNFHDIGRLKPGATIDQVRAQVAALNAANLERQPQFKEILINAGYYTAVEPLEEMLVKDVRGSLYLLWGGAGFVLLIGALNIANLVLARTALRRRELATRMALGAGPARLTRQLLVENVLLALAGGVGGIVLGAGLLRILSRAGLQQLPRSTEVRFDVVVTLAVLAMSAAVGLVIGAIPAMHVWGGHLGANLNSTLREASRSGTNRGASRVRQGLVVAEIGLAFVLLAGAGLLLVSFQQLQHVDPGFRAEGVITASTSLSRATYKEGAAVRSLTERSLEAFRHIPGVIGAGATTVVPWSGSHSDSVILAEGYRMKPGESLVSPLQIYISPGYFEAMGTPMIRGRAFDGRDRDGGPLAIIIDEKLAQHFWPDQDPIGRRMYYPSDIKDFFKVDEHTRWLTVVGVVRAVRIADPSGSGAAVGAYYSPLAQAVEHGFSYAVKASGDPAAVARAMRSELARLDPSLALFDVHMMTELGDLSLASRKAAMTLALGFGCLALFLSAIGIYGVLAYLVTQRRREIGIRTALGCTTSGIVRLVLREGLLLLGVGLVMGAAGAVAVRRAVETQIYGVQPLDPMVLTSVVIALSLVSLAACALPARRAAGVDPLVVLRED